MDVSVIIPVYNGEKYLRQCLDSLLDQDYQDFEIIAVNDASKDHSKDIVLEYAQKDKRIKLIDCEKNGGVSRARNIGIDNVQGKYITFVDCDDWVEKDYISTLISLFDENVCLTSCGNKYEKRNNRYFNDKNYEIIKTDDKMGLCNIFSDKNIFVFCTKKMFLTDIVKQIKFDESQKTGEDFLFVYEYIAHCKDQYVVHTTKRLYHYIKTKGSLSSMTCSEDKYRNGVKVVEKLSNLKVEPNSEIAILLNSRIDSWTFLILLQFIYYAHSLKLKNEVKRLKTIAKNLLPQYKKQQKNYSSFRRCGVFLYTLICLFIR